MRFVQDGHLAYGDELRAVASGATEEEEAIANLKADVSRLLEERGLEVRAGLAHRKGAVEI